MQKLDVSIVGCGLIGVKRALALNNAKFKLKSCFDTNINNAIKFSKKFNITYAENINEILNDNSINVIIIATQHNTLSELTLSSLKAGKNVLVEKPAGKFFKELEPVLDFLKNTSLKVKVGFNHRYHRAFLKANELIKNKTIGELMFIRSRYGHGGRIGYEKEWRSTPEISGGGELIDQGAHIIDLCRMYLGDFIDISGHAQTLYWNAPVDDNAFVILKNNKDQTAFFQVSSTEWKNMFSFEIYGRNGKIDINGLGGSYGLEKITLYKMLPEMGPPETYSWEYPMPDNSWEFELNEFYDEIINDKIVKGNIKDAYEMLKIVDKIYRNSKYDFCS